MSHCPVALLIVLPCSVLLASLICSIALSSHHTLCSVSGLVDNLSDQWHSSWMSPLSSNNHFHRFQGGNDIQTDVMTTFHTCTGALSHIKTIAKIGNLCIDVESDASSSFLIRCASNGESGSSSRSPKAILLITDIVDCDDAFEERL